MTANTRFTSFTSFNDFRNAYRADDSAPKATNNDLVRTWNIVKTLGDQVSREVVLPYATLNISQSSVRTVVSKLNTIFRHLGLMARGEKITINYVGFHHASVTFANVRLRGFSWTGDPAERTGRGQDRVSTRHEDGHREKHIRDEDRVYPLVA